MSNTATPSVEEMLNSALRKAEMQQKQMELEIRFKKNMEIFREVAKSIYDQFIDYKPEELRLSFDANGYLNLVNYNLDQRPVYAEDPVEFCKKQITEFNQQPSLSSIMFGKGKILNDEHFTPSSSIN
jgi:hypothetical protein